MKKLICSIALLAVTAVAANAQILNPGFEDLRSDGNVAKWGSIFLLPFPSPCEYVLDSALYFSTSDAHSGTRAIELRNAKCGEDRFGGSAHLMVNDEAYFDLGAPLTGPSPKTFSCYFKYFPVGNDTSAITVEVGDETEYVYGSAKIEFTKLTPEYTKISVPITYTASGLPSRVFINIANSNGTSVPNFGTRLLIDDVALEGAVNSVISKDETGLSVRCYPNPTTSAITFNSKDGRGDVVTLKIFNSLGAEIYATDFVSMLTLDCSSFAKGVYHYQANSKSGESSSGSLVIQ